MAFLNISNYIYCVCTGIDALKSNTTANNITSTTTRESLLVTQPPQPVAKNLEETFVRTTSLPANLLRGGSISSVGSGGHSTATGSFSLTANGGSSGTGSGGVKYNFAVLAMHMENIISTFNCVVGECCVDLLFGQFYV